MLSFLIFWSFACPFSEVQRVIPFYQSAEQLQFYRNVTNNTSREKPEEWPQCLAHGLKQSNRAKDGQILDKTFRVSNGPCLLSPRTHLYVVGMLPTELAHSFLYCSCVCFCLLWPFQLYFILYILPTTLRFLALLFRSYLSALLVLSTTCLFMTVSYQP